METLYTLLGMRCPIHVNLQSVRGSYSRRGLSGMPETRTFSSIRPRSLAVAIALLVERLFKWLTGLRPRQRHLFLYSWTATTTHSMPVFSPEIP